MDTPQLFLRNDITFTVLVPKSGCVIIDAFDKKTYNRYRGFVTNESSLGVLSTDKIGLMCLDGFSGKNGCKLGIVYRATDDIYILDFHVTSYIDFAHGTTLFPMRVYDRNAIQHIQSNVSDLKQRQDEMSRLHSDIGVLISKLDTLTFNIQSDK